MQTELIGRFHRKQLRRRGAITLFAAIRRKMHINYSGALTGHAIKKAQAIVLAAALFSTCISLGTVSLSAAQESWKNYAESDFAGGSGTAESPFLISSASQLAYLAQEVNTGTTYAKQYFRLTADISLSAHQWVPVGYNYSWTAQNTFQGSFDGAGYAVSGLKIGTEDTKNSNYPYAGFFGYLSGNVQNLSVSGSVYSAYAAKNGSADIGLLAGEDYHGAVKGCRSSGTVMGGKQANIGGLIGFNADANLTGCSSTAAVSGSGANDVGGLVGYCQAYSDPNFNGKGSFGISGCSATGKVTGGYRAGGLVGECSSNPDCGASITKSHASGNVSAGDLSCTGGLVGSLSSVKAVVSGCFASGGVTAGDESSSSGGLIGYIVAGTVRNSYASGTVTVGDRRTLAGGLVGWNAGNIFNSYATGAIRGGTSSSVGGFVGLGSNGSVQNCYASGSAAGADNADIGGFAGSVSGDTSSISFEKCYWNSSAAQAEGNSARAPGKRLGVGRPDSASTSCIGVSADQKKSGLAQLLSGNITALHLKGAVKWKYTNGKNSGFPVLSGVS